MTTPMDRLSRKARTQLFIGKIEQRYSAGLVTCLTTPAGIR
jgi:hypothetical protein